MKKIIMFIIIMFAFFSFLNVYAEDDCSTANGMQGSTIRYVTGTDETIESLHFCNTCGDNEQDLVSPKYGVMNKQFKGWYTGENGTGVKIEKTTDVLSDSIEPSETQGCFESIYNVYAYWGDQDVICPATGLTAYIINFDSKGGSNIESIRYSVVGLDDLAKEKDIFKVPTKQGYDFVGWYADETYSNRVLSISDCNKLSFTTIYNLAGCINGNYATVYANWSEVKLREDLVQVEDTGFNHNKLFYVVSTVLLIIGISSFLVILKKDR